MARSDDANGDQHELQSLSGRQTPVLRHYRHAAHRDGILDTPGTSSSFDEEYADETLRMRSRPSNDGTYKDDDDDEDLDPNAPLVGSSNDTRSAKRRNAEKPAFGQEDPMTIISQAVPETDDPSLPTLTFRVVVIGSFFCVLGAGISQLFFYKSNSPSFSSYFVILISLPLGRWMATNLPKRRVRILRWSFELNPGPFSIKEHLLIAVLSSSGATSAYASDIINIQELFFNQRMGTIASLILLLTTQTIGFGFAGLVHDLLVKPVSMIFPSTLVVTTMFSTLHAQRSVDTKARLQFFAMAFLAMFMYQFLPSLLMPTLSSMALLCFVNNEIPAFRALSSGYKGFGLPNISLDWNAISTSGPLYQPWWAALNFYAGIAGAMYIVMPVLYFTNFWDVQKFPAAIDSGLYENKTFNKFDVVSLLKPDNTLDWDKYETRKPMLLSPWFAISYGISFAVLTSMISHVFLWNRKDVVRAMKYPQHDDIHNQLMKSYPGVPRRWYATILCVSLFGAVVLVATTPLQLPVWGLLLAVSMSLLFLVPAGIVKAVSDTSIGLNVITEFVAGVLMPGRPIANVCFKCYGYMAMAQALDLVTDLKLAHYMKIPPKDMFISQLMGTCIGCFVNLAVVRIILNPEAGYRGFLDGSEIDPTSQWDGRKVRIFYSASILWGAIGPIEFFSGQYHKLFWGFALGAIMPIVPWLLNKKWPSSFWTLIHFPVLLHGAGGPPQLPTNVIISGFITAWLSQYWARRKHPQWFARRNYVLASALDAGCEYTIQTRPKPNGLLFLASMNALCVFLLSVTVLKIIPLPHWFMNPATDSEHCTPAL